MTEFAVPPGDPATLRSTAAALGGYAAEHARQLACFRAAVKTALAGWHGSAAEQYAMAAGEVGGRFTGVSETLKAGQAALNRYASELEDAQQEASRLNAAFAALPPPTLAPSTLAPSTPARPASGQAAATEPPGSTALRKQAQTAADALRAAQHACAQALDQARRALARSCSGELSAPQLLAMVKKIAGQLSDPAARHVREHGLSGWVLYADAAMRGGGGQPGTPGPSWAAAQPAAAAAVAGAARQAVPVTGAALAAAARWALGGGPGHEPPGILAGLPHNDDNMWNAPGEFAHALRSTADPVDW
jgi:uncharacterized protein YukE